MSQNVSAVSDDGRLCALFVRCHLNVYNTVDNKLLYKVKKRSGSTETKELKFSPSKQYISWLQSSSCQLDVAHIKAQKTSKIKIHPDLPFEHVLWSPDGRSLAAISSLSVFIDVYTVHQSDVSHLASIGGAKEDGFGQPLARFSPDGEYFATVSVSIQGYSITIYNSGKSSWDCIQRMLSNDCCFVDGILWCPDSTSLLVWQSGLHMQLRLWTVDGQVQHELAADNTAPTCVCLSSCGRMAALLTVDCKVRILDLLTWQLDVTQVLVHHPIIHKDTSRCRLKESGGSTAQVSDCEPITEMLYELNQDDSLQHKHHTLAQFSVDAQYLASYEPTYPNTVWIWRLVDDSPLDTVIVLRDDARVQGKLQL